METVLIEHDGIILLDHSVDPDSFRVFVDKRTNRRFKQCQFCGERIYEKEIGFVTSSKVSLTCRVCREAYFGEIRKPDDPILVSFPRRRMRDDVKYP